MIQKKRQQFKREFRRKQLDAMFKQKRIELLESTSFQEYAFTINTRPLGKQIADCVQDIERGLRSQNFQLVENNFDLLFKSLKEDVMETSAYMMVLSPAISRMLKSLIDNQESIDEGDNEWRILSSEDQSILVRKYFELLSLVNYRELREDYFLKLLASFWLVFTCDGINFYENHQIFELTLLIIKRMLNSKNRIVLSSLKSIGLGVKLTKIIQYDSDLLTLHNQLYLMEIIEKYVIQETMFNENDFTREINGKSLLEMQKSEKQVLVAFCLNVIDLKREFCFQLALNSLITIFSRHQYLIDSIAKYASAICALIQNPIPSIHLKALELTDDLIYHQDTIGFDLLKGSYLPDLLYAALLRHRKQPNEATHAFCCITSNILCNLSICKNKYDEKLPEHPIWELAYQNIQMGSPLIPLISAFEYLFEILRRKTAKKFLESYISSIGTLDVTFLEKRELEAIKRTIQRVYIKCLDFWPEGQEVRFQQMIAYHRVNWTLDDLMDIEEQKELRPL